MSAKKSRRVQCSSSEFHSEDTSQRVHLGSFFDGIFFSLRVFLGYSFEVTYEFFFSGFISRLCNLSMVEDTTLTLHAHTHACTNTLKRKSKSVYGLIFCLNCSYLTVPSVQESPNWTCLNLNRSIRADDNNYHEKRFKLRHVGVTLFGDWMK